jgi:hypothetical protein
MREPHVSICGIEHLPILRVLSQGDPDYSFAGDYCWTSAPPDEDVRTGQWGYSHSHIECYSAISRFDGKKQAVKCRIPPLKKPYMTLSAYFFLSFDDV